MVFDGRGNQIVDVPDYRAFSGDLLEVRYFLRLLGNDLDCVLGDVLDDVVHLLGCGGSGLFDDGEYVARWGYG